MADLTVMRVEEMETAFEGVFVRARESLGVSSFGMNVINLPANWDQYPEHDEEKSGQEEVYTVLSGSAKLIVAGKEHDLRPGVFARVGVATKRRIIPGSEGAQLLALGAIPGAAYVPPDFS